MTATGSEREKGRALGFISTFCGDSVIRDKENHVFESNYFGGITSKTNNKRRPAA